MYITSLHLTNFRNFVDERIEPGPKFNLILGSNAQGKTNIIEAIGLFANGRSFRSSEFRNMIKRGSSDALVTSSVVCSLGSDALNVQMDRQKKYFFKNGKKTSSGGFERFSVVIFAPEEILLLRDSPSERRRYIDSLICKIDPSYNALIRSYEQVVLQRNQILQDENLSEASKAGEIEPWDRQLVNFGVKVVVCRKEMCDRINELLPLKYTAVAPNDGGAFFIYRPQCGIEPVQTGEDSIREVFESMLKARRPDELKRGFTVVGPHRDDIEACLDTTPLKHFGSQGQHRTFVLALKISETEILRDSLGETPIFLLDDVGSELDKDRSKFFFDYLNSVKGQVFITATDSSTIRLDSGADCRCFEVVNGCVK